MTPANVILYFSSIIRKTLLCTCIWQLSWIDYCKKIATFKEEATSAYATFHAGPLLVELEFGDVGFCGERKTGKPGKKTRNKVRTNNKFNPRATLGSNQTQATLVRGESFHRCAIPATYASTATATTAILVYQWRGAEKNPANSCQRASDHSFCTLSLQLTYLCHGSLCMNLDHGVHRCRILPK